MSLGDDEHDNEIFLDTENNSENDRLKRKASNRRHLIDTEGSGFGISDDEDNKIGGMEYYEDMDLQYSESEDPISNRKPSSSNCQSILYDISSSKGKIKINKLNYRGSEITDSQQIANCFNEYFCNVAENLKQETSRENTLQK